MCWFLKINPFYTAKVNQTSWFLLDNSYKVFQQKEAATNMLSISTGTLCRLEYPDDLVEGWLICDQVALLGCLFLILTLFADHLPPSHFASHFKACCPFLKPSLSSLYCDLFHSPSNLPLIDVLSGKRHVGIVASKSWGLDGLCFSAGQSSTGAKEEMGPSK